jgi:hypothetical protein
MWILNWLPNWIFDAMVIGGLIGVLVTQFLSYIPLIGNYLLPIRIIAIAILVTGVWFEGANHNNEVWLARVKELEEKLKITEEKSKEVNTIIQEKIVYKTKIVKQIQVKVEERIKEVEKQIDSKCEVDTEALKILNDAAEMPK